MQNFAVEIIMSIVQKQHHLYIWTQSVIEGFYICQ